MKDIIELMAKYDPNCDTFKALCCLDQETEE
jgi:hypothetical protein